ncbi:Serine/threonine-protein kinase prk-2 [Labeo rohita]|uniref:non-specific serine/threonine protein kinase n=1 Tax=Labeo rohita TaxID=84645 RepID=A0ABQ8L335_LABRO|nr:Serine/threonine-protein kinase prk-2 [Labeo rohita]
MLGRVQSPPCENVIRLSGFHKMPQKVALAMEYPWPCLSLAKFLRRNTSRLPEETAGKLFHQLVLALQHTHSGNVLINTKTQQLKVHKQKCMGENCDRKDRKASSPALSSSPKKEKTLLHAPPLREKKNSPHSSSTSSPLRGLQEADILGRVQSPPCENVIRLCGFHEIPQKVALVMEYPWPCLSLAKFLRRNTSRLPEETARKLFHQPVLAFQHCIDCHVYHLDTHSGNVLINTETQQLNKTSAVLQSSEHQILWISQNASKSCFGNGVFLALLASSSEETPVACPEETVRKLFHQFVLALQHCIDCHVYHLDTHSGNVLINTKTQQLKLIDFSRSSVLRAPGELTF